MNKIKIALVLFIIIELFSCDKYNLDRTNPRDGKSEDYNPKLPTVITAQAKSITGNSAILGGNVTSDGFAEVTARGVYYDTLKFLLIARNSTVVNKGTGLFESNVTGLLIDTKYYFKAYATNSVGTVYGQMDSLNTCGLPAITTSSISLIESTSAVCGGNITSDGGANVTERGVCWSINPYPTVDLNTRTYDGTGVGSFTSNLIELTAETTYHIRAYATNLAGTAYGGDSTFTTSDITIILPTVITSTVSNINTTTATSGGEVTSDGRATVTARGVCWSTSQNPTTYNCLGSTNDGTSTGSYASSITGLTCGTTYYVRAYAANSTGTAYGNQVSFTTSSCQSNMATVSTFSISSITETSANGGGDVTSDGGATVTARGVCWSTSQNPTISNCLGSTNDGSGTGSYTSNITGLTCNTTYYVRAYAVNSAGTAYGNQISFTTSSCMFNMATVSTSSISSITEASASGGGDVTSDGGTTVTARGLCWSTSQNPTTGDCMGSTNDGSGTGSYTSSITGLTCGTTYYVRAYAVNSAGTAYGNQVSFTPPCPGQSTVTTSSISNITETSASGGGNITSDGGATVTARGVCWSTSQNPTTGNCLGSTNDGSGTGNYTSSITGLTCGTTYYVRAYAVNSAGTAYGTQVSFTTSPCLPEVTTSSISNITETSASGGGNVTSDGGATVTSRGVCWSTSQNPTTGDCLGSTNDGSGTGSYTSSITGLTCGTTYYVRAYAVNSAGTAYGSQVSFTASSCNLPTVLTSSINDIDVTYSTAQGGGDVTSDGGASVTAKGVCWSISQNPTLDNCLGYTNDGTSTGSFISNITGLSCGTVYYVRAYAVNNVGTAYGTQDSFVTPPCEPVVETSSINTITQTSATGGGNVVNTGIGNLIATGICWSTSQNPTIDNCSGLTNDGTSLGLFTSTITGLTCNTTYYVRAYATNEVGTEYGLQVSFTTSSCSYDPPTVSTSSISNINETSASGGGNVTSDGGATVTSRGVCWSTSQNPTTGYCLGSTNDGSGTGSYTSSITELTCGTTYYVRAYAVNSAGTAYGNQVSFTPECINPPTVSTSSISNITETSASGGGNVTSDGGTTVTSRGICWSTSQNPTTGNCLGSTNDGSGIGNYSSTITGLSPNTFYYVRAYATNSAGSSYGDQVTFTSLTTLTTTEITGITSVSAMSGGTINEGGGATITARGVCWSTTENPTIANSKTNDGTGNGNFTSTVTNLTPNQLYYIRAYATNNGGTSYGDNLTFTTPPIVTDIDFNTYSTVRIGTWVWMAENLKVTHYRNGEAIIYINEDTKDAWGTLTEGAYVWYNYSSSNKNLYGAMYNFFTVIDAQGLCPAGWHVPSRLEWTQLENYLGGNTVAGGKLKEEGTSHWLSPNTGATNQTRFTALPVGFYLTDFSFFGETGLFWTSEQATGTGWCRSVDYDSNATSSWMWTDNSGISVRCIKD